MINNKPILVHSPKNEFLQNLIENNSLALYSSEEKQLFKNIDYIFSNFKSFEKNGKNGFDLAKKYFSSEHAKKVLFKNIK